MVSLSFINYSISELFVREGGVVEDPDDRGGLTNLGITLPFLSEYLGREATREELINLSHQTAFKCYQDNLIYRYNLHLIEDHLVFDCILDSACHHGCKPDDPTFKMMQRIVHAKIDGIFGPQTRKKLDEYIASKTNYMFLKEFTGKRIDYMVGIAQKNPSQLKFLRNWVNRAYKFLP